MWGISTFMGMIALIAVVGLLLSQIGNIQNIFRRLSFAPGPSGPSGPSGSLSNIDIYILIGVIISALTSIILYFASVVRLQGAYLLGKRKQEVCGNEFMEAETGNYNMLIRQLPGEVPYIKSAFSFLIFTIALCMIKYIYSTNVVINPFNGTSTWASFFYSIWTNKAKAGITCGLFIAFVVFIIGFPASFSKIIENSGKSYADTDSTRDDMKALIGTSASSLGMFFILACARIYMTDEDKISKALTLGLFTVLCIVLYFQCDSLTRLLQVNLDYKAIVRTLAAKVSQLLAGKSTYDDVRASALAGQTTTLPNIAQQFCMYLTKNIKALHQHDDLDPSDTNLWPYIMHKTNGKELDEILKNCESKKDESNAKAITKFTTCGTSPACTTTSDGIREILRVFRRYNTGEHTINRMSSMSKATFAIAMLLVTYPVFHTFYRSDPDFTTIVVALSVLSLFGFGGMYGWASQVAP